MSLYENKGLRHTQDGDDNDDSDKKSQTDSALSQPHVTRIQVKSDRGIF